jgi:hypothetical protein
MASVRRADPLLHIRSAILKTSQPRAAKLKPQKSMTVTIALTFLQDDYELTARVQVTNC